MFSELIVAKFGGTSVADMAAMRRSAAIVQSNPNIRVVVVSATAGTTNSLVELIAEVARGGSGEEQILKLEDRHLGFFSELPLAPSTESAIKGLTRELREAAQALRSAHQETDRAQLRDLILSFGERLAAPLFSSVLTAVGVSADYFDVRKVLTTDSNFGRAEPNLSEIARLTQELLAPQIGEGRVQVTEGFIGLDTGGHTTTLGRGGSDYSAALLAEGLCANVLQIWTDVPGIYTCDPRIVPDARPIERLGFAETAELANFGAKVLHPATLWPAVRSEIKVFVGSSIEPERGGSWIYPEISHGPAIRAIALRRDQTLITVTSLKMLNTYGFLARLFGVLATHRVSVDLVTTSEVSVALTIDGRSASSSTREWDLSAEIRRELEEFCEVKIERDLTLIAVIGNRMTSSPGLCAKVLGAVPTQTVRMVCQGASQNNLCFLVESAGATEAAQSLHRCFLGPASEPRLELVANA